MYLRNRMQLNDVPLSMFELWISLPNTVIHISESYIWATWLNDGQSLDLWLIDEDVAEYKKKYQLGEEE